MVGKTNLIMCHPMIIEITGGWDGGIRVGWWEKFYLIMCHPMIVEVTGCSEAFPAGLALMWFLPGVDPTMRVERRRRREGFTTNITSVGLLTCGGKLKKNCQL